MNLSEKLSNLNIAIVSHFSVTAPIQELEAYLIDKVDGMLFIRHPFNWDKDIRSYYKVYHQGKLIKERKTFRLKLPQIFVYRKVPQIFLYLKDALYTFFWIVSFRQSFDLYVGVDSIDTSMGVVLKRIGRIKRLVFYVGDYYTQRFDNKILNKIDQLLDEFCLRNCDYVWNSSPLTAEAREKRGLKKGKIPPQLTVPVGVSLRRIKSYPIDQINRLTIVYMGRLVVYQGIELIIEALPDIISEISEVRLIIIGTGPYELEMRKKVKELRLEDHVTFTGFIKSHEDIERILKSCTIGVAPYLPDPKSSAWHTDVSKPKIYLACGLPVIITRVPWIAKEIEKAPMGIAINYDRSEMVNAAIKLLKDDEFHRKCRENTVEFASTLSWDRIWSETLSETLQVKRDI